MKTSYFFRFQGKKLRTPGLISIARHKPFWFEGPEYDKLAPPAHALGLHGPEFVQAYRHLLAQLDPLTVFKELGEDAILLCWESPINPEFPFCHRRLVAEWLEESLGVQVPEVGNAHLQGGLFR